MLAFGQPEFPEVWKNTVLLRLCWVLFPIDDLKQAVKTTDRILTKKKIGDLQVKPLELYS